MPGLLGENRPRWEAGATLPDAPEPRLEHMAFPGDVCFGVGGQHSRERRCLRKA